MFNTLHTKLLELLGLDVTGQGINYGCIREAGQRGTVNFCSRGTLCCLLISYINYQPLPVL